MANFLGGPRMHSKIVVEFTVSLFVISNVHQSLSVKQEAQLLLGQPTVRCYF